MTRLIFLCYISKMSNLTLHNYFRSSTSYRVRIALEAKSLKYNYIPVHLINNGGEQNAQNYRTLNPAGGVPTLVHNEKVISQSFAIIEYLDEVFPESAALFPKDAFERSKIRQVCEVINSDIHPLSNLKVTHFLEKEFKITADQKSQWQNKWITEGLSAVEKTLAPYSGKFCFGDTMSAADLFLIPQLFSSLRFGVDISVYKQLSAINDNCLALEAFKKAHPLRQIDTPEDIRIN